MRVQECEIHGCIDDTFPAGQSRQLIEPYQRALDLATDYLDNEVSE